MDARLIEALLGQTQVLRAPKRRLSTFGATSIEYHLISPVADLEGRTRLRQGRVRSERPRILTAESFAQRFEGFGEEARAFAAHLSRAYRDLLRALEYNFKNEGLTARVLSEPAPAVADRVLSDLEGRDAGSEAVIRCPDAGWSLALMKLTLDESSRSFPVNVRDLERRGLFDPERAKGERERARVEALFEAAGRDRSRLPELGRLLRESGLFPEYEDRFLGLY